MRNKIVIIITMVIVLMFVMISFSNTVYTNNKNTFNNTIITPDSFSEHPIVNLYDTESFYGEYNNKQVFTGTVYYYYIPYANGGETNPNYNWYIIGVQIFRGSDGVNLGGTSVCINLNSNHVWNVDGGPIKKSPLSSPTITIGAGGPSISTKLDYNGYDKGNFVNGDSDCCGGFVWNHCLTMADQNNWNTLSGGYAGKVSATNSQASVWGYTSISFYMWNTGGWWPYGSTSSWIYAEYDSGASCYITYPCSVDN